MKTPPAIAEHGPAGGGRDQLAERRDAILQRHVIRASCPAVCAQAEWRRAGRRPGTCPPGLLRVRPRVLCPSNRPVMACPSCGPCAPPFFGRWAREALTSIRFAWLGRRRFFADRL